MDENKNYDMYFEIKEDWEEIITELVWTTVDFSIGRKLEGCGGGLNSLQGLKIKN
jgi:hypothetical protein